MGNYDKSEKEEVMSKSIHVVVVEDDSYSRDLMVMLLTRDWRTQVVSEISEKNKIQDILKEPLQKIDVILLDTESPWNSDWPFQIADIINSIESHPVILCTGTIANPFVLKQVLKFGFSGYVLKPEIRYSLAWAVKEAAMGNWVMTKGVWRTALQERIQLPEKKMMLDGTKNIVEFTERQWEIARLAVIFNQTRREIADELLIRVDSVSEIVSTVYKKLGIQEVVGGTVPLESYIDDAIVQNKLEAIVKHLTQDATRKKISDISTLAFHLLTIPDVEVVF